VGVAIAALVVTGVVAVVTRERPPPVVFVHGMGADAREIGAPGGPFASLLGAVADRYPRPGVCQRDAQPGRDWEGSPCVFRYADDVAAGGRSASSVTSNARKLAAEVAEVAAAAGEPVVLIGYSMGGTIVRAFVSLHPEQAADDVRGVILLHGVASGSWLLAGDRPLRDFVPDAPEALLTALIGLATDLEPSPAARDLTPGSALMHLLAAASPPADIAYTTVWGDIDLELDVPGVRPIGLPSIGDVVILPGTPDPAEIPALGGQRFSPGPTALEIRHRDTVTLDPADLGRMAAACALPLPPDCRETARDALSSPSAHWRIPESLDEIEVRGSPLGDGSLQDLVLDAVEREV
jgi:pimeloyl-ACP methyl ester carboxylesterase